MLARINGYSKSGVLGYFYGNNTLVSVAVAGVLVKDTGAVASLVDVRRFLNDADDATVVDYLNTKGIVRVDGTAFVVGTLAADYQASFSAQTNLKRIVDIVQQRAVILATSDIATGVAVAGFSYIQAGQVVNTAAVADANVITFLVERADVFNKDAKSLQGVPTGTVEVGRNLIDDLTGVSLLAEDGSSVVLAATDSSFAVKLYATIPALSI